MASPFTIFRRNQRIMLAVLGVAAMVAFVFLDPLMRYVGRQTDRRDAVVVETKYGNLNESELANLRDTRKIAQEFVKRLVERSIMQVVEQKQIDPRQIDMEGEVGQALQLLSIPRPPGDEAAIETFVLAKRAEQLGMVVSDNVINEFIKQITFDTLNRSQIVEIIGQLRPMGNPVSQGRLFDAMRTELLASRFARMFRIGMAAVPPGQRWDYFERLNRRASVELLAVPVANSVSKVKDPNDVALRKFFDQYKDRLPTPGSPEPGFKQPKKAAFQYFKADFEAFLKQAKDAVTDEQIAEYYEKNKDTRFRAIQLPPENDAKDAKPKAPEEKETSAAGKEAPAPDKEAPVPGKETPAPGAESKSPDGAAVKPAPENPPTTPPAVPAAEKAAEPKVTEPKEGPAADKSPKSTATAVRGAVRLVSSPTRVVALADPATAPAAPAEKAATEAVVKPLDPKTEPAATPAAPEKPAVAAPATDKPATEKPAEEKLATESPAAEKPTGEKPAAEAKYEPLEKVSGDVRTTLAQQEARQRINKALSELESIMKRYAEDRIIYDTQGKSEGNQSAPEPLDFAALAKQFGVAARETDLVSAEEARDETDIGRSYIPIVDPRSRFGEQRMQPFEEVAYNEILYKPNRSQDLSSTYLFWKTRQTEEQVPDFDTVRSGVLRQWKMIEARKIAQEKAKKYLEDARRDKLTLEEMYGKQPELKVITPPAFSWMTLGNVPRDPAGSRPRLNEVAGADQPGNDFMRAVFDLEPGDYAVALNQPQTVAYVIHLLNYDRSLEALFEQFGQEKFAMYWAVGESDRENAYSDWIKGLMTEARVHWERDPVTERNRL